MLYILLFLIACFVFHYISSNKFEKLYLDDSFTEEENVSALNGIESDIVI